MILQPIDKAPDHIVMEIDYKSNVTKFLEFATYKQAIDYIVACCEQQQKNNIALKKRYCLYTCCEIEY